MLKDLVEKNRTRRRFHQEVSLQPETLRSLVNLARLSPSAGNLQSLKYILSCDPAQNAEIFKALTWAAYLKDWPGPEEGERPSGYIIILGDTGISKSSYGDHGIAAQSIMLGAVEAGLGGCIIGAINREKLRKSLDLDSQYEILLVLALGEPKEVVKLEEVGSEGDIKYWRDEAGVHHVPKRLLDGIILSD